MTILYHPKVQSEDIPKLGHNISVRIEKAISERIAVDPEKYGQPLRRGLRGYRKVRVSDYRIIYSVKENQVRILIIGHRSDVYKRADKRKVS